MARTLVQLAELNVSVLNGVGPAKAKGLAELGVTTVLDLLTHYPRRYIDRTRQEPIGRLRPDDEAAVLATVTSCATRTTRSRKRMVTAIVADDTGSMSVTFFNQPWRQRQLTAGTEVVVFGRVQQFRGRPQMTNPVVDLVGDATGRIVPVYPQSAKGGITTAEIGRLVAEVLRRAGTFAEPVPTGVLDQWGLVDRTSAYIGIHTPASMAEVTTARNRLVFDELLRLQLWLVQRKRHLEASAVGLTHDPDGPLVDRLQASLPFALTDAQRRVIADIAADMATGAPMHRLLQGDVGSGKTLVALMALLIAIQSGHQGALMAPTEVLAEQHAAGIGALLEGFTVPERGSDNLFSGDPAAERPLRVSLLTNRTPAAQRRRILTGIADGTVELVIGTHALLGADVAFRQLGLAVIDEQHRFGVEQRAALRTRSTGDAVPDVLVMTATPIPRTAAMTVYGDLDVSVLDAKPPGRTPVVTSWARTTAEVDAVWASVCTEVAAGRQVYVVCPLIDTSDKLDAAAAEDIHAELAGPQGPLSALRVGLMHGRLPPVDRDGTMEAFRAGDLDVLVATTVIEVGVDVPNATVMVIIDADRFGIAQLHQLRGRVGRGAHASQCYLIADPATPQGEARIEALVGSEDGFALAEIDLELRGEGTVLGERQKGRNDLRLASLRRDAPWVLRARQTAEQLVEADGSLTDHEELAAELDATFDNEAETEFLLKG